jgi:pyruvate dehydrogenase E1 component alpha subunit
LNDLSDRAAAYAIPGISVDGQDVEAVYRVMADAIARCRRGEGPTLVESKTYRYSGHSRTDPGKYRPDGELDAWKLRDPIHLLGARLIDGGLQTAEEQEAIWTQTQADVDRIAAELEADGSVATIEQIRGYVYAG